MNHESMSFLFLQQSIATTEHAGNLHAHLCDGGGLFLQDVLKAMLHDKATQFLAEMIDM